MTEATGSAGAGSPTGANAGAGANAAGAAAATGAVVNAAPDIFSSLSPDLQANPALAAYKKDTGFDFPGLAKEHVNLQGLIGAKGVIPPAADAPPEHWDRFYNTLGRPEKADGYQFEKPQGFEGYSDEFAGAYRSAAHKHGLSAKQAAGMHDWFVKSSIDAATSESAKSAENGTAMETTLRTKWGAAYDAKVAGARKAAQDFAPEAAVDKLEKALGSVEVMELFANIEEKRGEAGLVGRGNTSFTPTPDQAKAEIAKMDAQMNDPKGPAMDALHPEHAAWMKRREQLFAMAFPG